MNKTALSQWVAAATNVAVLLGVLLLVIELRQNAELARLEMAQSRVAQFQQAEAAFFHPSLSEIWVKSFTAPASMTLAEIRAMDAYLAIHMAQMMREYELEKAGLVKEGSTVKLMEGDFPFLFGSRFARAWWDQWEHTWPPELIEQARPILEATDEEFLNQTFRQFQKELGAE